MGRGSEGWEGVASKEAYTVHTKNIISQWQYFVARYLSSYVGNVFGLASSDLGETNPHLIISVYIVTVVDWTV
jgi:hypothetical protein